MFNIIIEDDLWISSRSDNLATTFCLEVEGLYFPSEKWSDLEKNEEKLIVKCVKFGFNDFFICTQFTCEYMTFLEVVYSAVKQFAFFLYQLSEKDARWKKVYESYIFLKGELKRGT